MPLKKIFKDDDLNQAQRNILAFMKEGQTYSDENLLIGLQEKGQEATNRQALVANLRALKDRRYLDKNDEMWIKVRDVPLALEYIDAKVFMREADSRVEFLWKFFSDYVQDNKNTCDTYARAYKKAVKARRNAWETDRETRKIMEELDEKQKLRLGKSVIVNESEKD
jgi:hypothetical protein